jgi:lipopolysaccharide transport system permease protein
MPLLMFLSPVFYRPSYLPFNGHFVWLNPLSHLIEIVRYPLLGSPPPGFVVLTTVLLAAGGWIFTLWLFNAKRNRIAYWL